MGSAAGHSDYLNYPGKNVHRVYMGMDGLIMCEHTHTACSSSSTPTNSKTIAYEEEEEDRKKGLVMWRKDTAMDRHRPTDQQPTTTSVPDQSAQLATTSV